MNDHTNTIINGAIGFGASVAGVSVSFMPQIETSLRLFSLTLGVIIGCITLYRLLRKNKHRR